MLLILPNRTDVPFYDFDIDLDGAQFTLEWKWNDREGAWYLTIYGADGTTLLAGRKVVLGVSLIARFRDARLPAGDMMALDTSGRDFEPGINDLGGRVVVVYSPAADLPARYLA